MSAPAKCAHCGEPLVIVINFDDKPITDRLERIEQELVRNRKDQEKDMAELDTELDGIEGAQAAEHTDVQRIIADLEAKETAGTITDDERTRLEALKASIAADTAAIDAGDPAPVVTDPGTGDGGDAPATV